MELVLIGDTPLASAAAIPTFETGPDALLIDAWHIGFVCPLDLAGMLAIAYWASAAAMPVTFRLPREPNAASYLQRMDVLRQMPRRTRIVGRIPPEERANLRHRLLEASPLTEANVNDLAERLGSLVTAYYPKSAGPAVARACNELLDNAVEHGASNVGAFITAQTYTGTTTGSPRLELAVCDNGIGILSHLRQNPEHQHLTTDEQALKKAMKDGITGTSDKRGYGLSDLIGGGRKHGTIRLHLRTGAGEISVTATSRNQSAEVSTRRDITRGVWAWLTHELPAQA
ncbi:ATP-binding protein [Haloechinothrix halophila]|uniref:ATP-binding protein n=1 Tax=Haloechinothrix halophila TaxID=1069073 RepID=UPI0005592C10|nr:ATP-binding protein [Haloechinothrix halophila]